MTRFFDSGRMPWQAAENRWPCHSGRGEESGICGFKQIRRSFLHFVQDRQRLLRMTASGVFRQLVRRRLSSTMDYDQLASFMEVARLRSFSRAAEQLFRTQPAISA